MLNADTDREWGNFTTSLGLSQLISEPTRVTSNNQTLRDHIYTINDDNIRNVDVEKLCVSDHYGFFAIDLPTFRLRKIMNIKSLHTGHLNLLMKPAF